MHFDIKPQNIVIDDFLELLNSRKNFFNSYNYLNLIIFSFPLGLRKQIDNA